MSKKEDILYKIYQANAKVNVFDLLYEFGTPYRIMKSILDEYTADKILETEDGKYYTFIGDGRMFSERARDEKESEEREEGEMTEARRLEIIREMQRRMEEDDEDEEDEENTEDEEDECEDEEGDCEDDEDEEDEEDGEEDKYKTQRMTYIAARRRELMNDLQRRMEEDDEEDDEDDEDDDEDEEDPGIVDDLCQGILENLHIGADVKNEDGKYIISVHGLKFGANVKFELFSCDERVYLGDQGATLRDLKKKCSEEEAQARIERIAAESNAEIIKDMLCVRVYFSYYTLARLIQLYAVMQRVLCTEES